MEKKKNYSTSEELTIAVVEDESDILELVSLHLRKHNFKVREFYDISSFYRYLNTEHPDLIILDLMLPDADGMEVCKKLKLDDNFKHIPIIILTARSDEMEKVLGLELGADDYVTKPFSPRELVARVKAVLRRDRKEEQPNVVTFADILKVDFKKFEVFVNDIKVDLTPSEFKILALLLKRKGWVFTRENILDELGSSEKGVLDRTVDVHIKNLREKLGPAGSFIKNVRGVGYKIATD
ncbi:MAG: response regulator transcription factor [Candidatus Kapaibacteriota bacterium]|jgi:two-component system phosphate regulon response regulator PhoB/two-component system alkaline phosphatase synthesis response regulator PhoP